jgi:hypothetical protein
MDAPTGEADLGRVLVVLDDVRRVEVLDDGVEEEDEGDDAGDTEGGDGGPEALGEGIAGRVPSLGAVDGHVGEGDDGLRCGKWMRRYEERQ